MNEMAQIWMYFQMTFFGTLTKLKSWVYKKILTEGSVISPIH